MGKTMFEKIWDEHIVTESKGEGKPEDKKEGTGEVKEKEKEADKK